MEDLKNKANKIINNLDFEILKVQKDNDGFSVLLKDKNSNFIAWFDMWLDINGDGEYCGEWQQYIFNISDNIDMLKKLIQENATVYEKAYNKALEII